MKKLYIIVPAILCLFLMGGICSCETIGQAKNTSDGTAVSIIGSISYIEPMECYIQSRTDLAGIWVQANTQGFKLGDSVTATGSIETQDGERVLQNAALSIDSASTVIKPIGMNNKTLGGACSNGQWTLKDFKASNSTWNPVNGACNTGLLAKIWGTVNTVYYSPNSSANWFFIDDGSGVVSDNGDKGVLVYSDAAVEECDIVAVTGVSSVEPSQDDPSRLVRVLRTRTAGDVQILGQQSDPVYPFSDEFNATTLDGRWYLGSLKGGMSLSTNPGYLTLTTKTTASQKSASIAQRVPGNWDMVLKANLASNTGQYSGHIKLMLDQAVVVDVLCYSDVPFAGSRYLYPSAFGTDLGMLDGDTCYIRLRLKRPVMYCSVSADGVNYTPEVSTQINNPRWFEFYASTSWNTTITYTALVDYIRFTRVSQ